MGNFFQAVHIRHPEDGRVHAALAAAAEKMGFRCWVAPRHGSWIGAFPSATVSVGTLARVLSQQLGAEVIATLVHDSDLFSYVLARDGLEVDEFASGPEYFADAPTEARNRAQGDAAKIVHLLADGFARVDLDAWFGLSAAQRPEALMSGFHDLLGIGAGLSSYEYLERGETDGVTEWSRFIHVPDLTAEKAAKKAQRERVTAAKKTLLKAGVLLFDSTLGRNRQAFDGLRIHGAHPAGGFVCSHFDNSPVLAHWQPPALPRPLGFGPTNLLRHGPWPCWLDAETLVVETSAGRCALNVLSGEQRPFYPERDAAFVGTDAMSATGYFVSRTELIGIDLRTNATRFAVPQEFFGYDAILHPRKPHLVRWGQRGVRIFDKLTGAEIANLTMFNPANAERKATQWRAKGVEPCDIVELDREDVLTIRSTRDGESLIIGTSEGLRVYRYADLLAASSRMPAPAYSVDTTRELQDYRWVNAVALDHDRDVAVFSQGDDSLHAYRLSTHDVRELSPALDHAHLLQLAISGDVMTGFRRGYLGQKRREDEFSYQAWSIPALLQQTEQLRA